MSCETLTHAERWRRLMQEERVDYAEYRAIFGVCDNTARNHLDHASCEPRAGMIALAVAAFGARRVFRALWGDVL